MEAGAQGEHKVARGYLPSLTYSSHYVQDPEFTVAVKDFLRREAADVLEYAAELEAQVSPYKRCV